MPEEITLERAERIIQMTRANCFNHEASCTKCRLLPGLCEEMVDLIIIRDYWDRIVRELRLAARQERL